MFRLKVGEAEAMTKTNCGSLTDIPLYTKKKEFISGVKRANTEKLGTAKVEE